MDASKSFHSPGGDGEDSRPLVNDQSSIMSSTSAAERADNDAHRGVQQPRCPRMDDQSSIDDSSSEGRGSSPLSGYNPDSDGSGTDGGDAISNKGEHRPVTEGTIIP